MTKGTGSDLSELEHSWLSTHLTVKAPNARIEDLRRNYYVQVLGTASANESVQELELRWLRTLTGAGTNHNDLALAWQQVVAGAGLTPQPSMLANKVLYFSNVA